MAVLTDSPTSTVEDIVAKLTDAVHEHRVQPGTKLREDDVGDIFGVSRTLVRQALRNMEHDGLVTIERNKGAFVSKPTLKEAREVFETRALLEPTMARAAATRATGRDIARLEQHIEAERKALEQGETGRALKLSGDFHVLIASVADQSTIEEFLRQLVSRSALVIALYWRRRNALCDSSSHKALVEAFRQGDADSAEEVMKGHLLDLLTQLDLSDRPPGPASLKDALRQ